MRKDSLFVVWENPRTGLKRVIGVLSKTEDGYTFQYRNLKEARKDGFQLLVPFPDGNKKYKSRRLFPIFECRLPSSKREDIDDILSKYKMKRYNSFELLRRSGGRSPIDNLRFISPQ